MRQLIRTMQRGALVVGAIAALLAPTVPVQAQTSE